MKKYFLSGIILVLLFVPVLALGQLDLGESDLEDFGTQVGYEKAELPQVVGNIVKIVLSLLGLVAVVLIIIAGFQWMTSAGNEEKIKGAKKLMGSALIGLIIVILAYAIANFVIDELVTITD
jgi:type IV secretory pathway VirB2 component (pilin)